MLGVNPEFDTTNMTHRVEILEKIKQAMKFACDQSELFTDARAEPIAAEYLFTVAVAMKIAELNGPPGEPYVIMVERDATTFTKDCLHPIKFEKVSGFGKAKIVRRGKIDACREGRIDVAVYFDKPNGGYWGGVQPLCAIEVKGFDPNKATVIPDLVRNLSFLNVKGDTGESVLDFTVFAAFHSYTRLGEQDLLNNEQRVREKYESYLKEIGDLSDVDTKVEVLSVSVEQVGTIIQGIDYDELDTSSRHHFVGAMVVMSRAVVDSSVGP